MLRIPELISANSFSYCPLGRLFTFCCHCKSNLTPASTVMVFLVNKLDAWPFQLIFKPLRSRIQWRINGNSGQRVDTVHPRMSLLQDVDLPWIFRTSLSLRQPLLWVNFEGSNPDVESQSLFFLILWNALICCPHEEGKAISCYKNTSIWGLSCLRNCQYCCK